MEQEPFELRQYEFAEVAVDTIVAGVIRKISSPSKMSAPFPVNPQEHANYG
jgi:hypothetical protein